MVSGWKTFIVSLMLAVFGALETFDYTQFLNESVASYVVTGVGVVMFILRALTKTPIFKSE